jgi:hypothetical protein
MSATVEIVKQVPSAAPVEVPPYPARGDKAGWAAWWQASNAAYRKVGASAKGIFPEEEPPALAERIVEAPPLSGECRSLRRGDVEEIVRDVLAKDLPAAVAFLSKRNRE